MSDETLTCGKCGTALEINTEHVVFKGGKKAYIKCPNPACNNQRRISFDVVEHLKPNIEEIHKYVEEHGIKPEESIKSVSTEPKPKDEIPKIIQDAITEEQDVKTPTAEGEKDSDSEGLRWIIGGIAGLFGLGALIAWGRR